MKLLHGLAAGLALSLAGCAGQRPASAPWYREIAFAPPEVEAAWARYHWYVADVRYDFRTRESATEGYRGPVSYADIYLVVKALTDEGSQIGTLNIPYWNRNIHSMRATLLDAAGNELPVDQASVLATYREKGAVVLPQVTRGSVVALHIRQGPFMVLDYWEYPMQGLVPAWNSRFRFSHPERMDYAWQGYNGLGAPAVSSADGQRTLEWKAQAILPLDDIPFLDPAGARPRLAITRRGGPMGGGFPDWRAVAALRMKEHFTGPAEPSPAIRALAAEVIAGSAGDSAKADRLLAWVQDNVAWDPESPAGADWDRVASSRRGDLWQLAGLLRELYSATGLEAGLMLTRGRDQGGFDPAMTVPNAAWEPVVTVRAGGRVWAALPHARAYGLGDYPATLYGQQGLSLPDGACLPLPPPRYPEALMETDQDAPLEAARERRVAISLEGPWAGMARTEWYEGEWPDLAAFCGSFLADLGFASNVLGCTEAGMEARNRPLRLEATVAHRGSVVDRGGARQASFAGLFTRPAWFYDSSRADAYRFPFAQTRRETVRFRTPAGMRLEADIPCLDSRDSLPSVACRRETTEDGFAFTRETRLPAGSFPSAELRARQAAFADLDGIESMQTTIKPAVMRGVSARPAGAVRIGAATDD